MTKIKYCKAWEIKGITAKPPHNRTLKVLLSPYLNNSTHIAVGMTLLPPGNSSNLHKHDKEIEIFYILSGRGEVAIDNEKVSAEKDMAIYVPPKSEHQLINSGDETFKVLWMFSPPGPEKELINT